MNSTRRAKGDRIDPATDVLKDMFDRLLTAYGPQGWWPAKTPTEVVIGAILTQNTAWTNVERAIARLEAANCLDLVVIHALTRGTLEDLIRPAGTYRVKARRLQAFAAELVERFDGSLEAMLDGPLDACRRRLLALHGVGPETADAILLYAAGKPTFVVDAYTRRVLTRHGLIDASASYDSIRDLFHKALPVDAPMFNEYHALLVTLAKRHCRAKPLCGGCPLQDLMRLTQGS